jgi:putative transposase
MKLRYKYRLYPNKEQEITLKKFGGATRYIWNHFLNKQIQEYNTNKKFIFFAQMCQQLTNDKQNTTWLKDIHSQVLQQKLKDLDTALKNCFKYKRGFPKYKKKSNFSDSFRYTQGIKIKGNKVYLPKIGWVVQALHRKLPSIPSSATIMLDGNKWYISYVVDKQEQTPIIPTRPVGIDLGIKEFLVTSDGEVIDNPRFLDKSLRRLKRKQRQLSRKVKGSNNRKKQQLVVYLTHKQIRNQRHNFLHQISAQITNEYDLICMESLNVKGMMANRKLSRAIGQLGWSMFCSMLEYKSKLKGHHTVRIDRFAPSSKTCSACGTKHQLTLGDRWLSCSCGLSMDRDANAAINIRNWGYAQYTAGTAEINACGVQVSHRIVPSGINGAWTMKQEALILKDQGSSLHYPLYCSSLSPPILTDRYIG